MVIRLNSISRAETRLRQSRGSNSAVKNPTVEKQTTPTDTLDALMLP